MYEGDYSHRWFGYLTLSFGKGYFKAVVADL